jgi:hypothetical protein
MKRILYVGTLALLLALPGCRSNGSQDLLERELRLQEDKLYSMESCLCDYQQRLESCQRENDTLRQQLADPASQSSEQLPASSPRRQRLGGNGGSSASGNAELLVPDVTLPGNEQAPPYKGPPQISPPDPTRPDGDLPPRIAPPQNENQAPPQRKNNAPDGMQPPTIELPEIQPRQSGMEPQSETLPAPTVTTTADSTDTGETVSSLQVAEITLNKQLTGGYNTDLQAGDEGVMVVIEPRNSTGEVIRAPGKVSIVVMDPALQGEAARVARWDFSPADAANHFRKNLFGVTMQFELPWPNRPPQHAALTVIARYTTDDGRKLEARKDIVATLPRIPTDLNSGNAPDSTAPISTQPISTQPISTLPAGRQAQWTRSTQPQRLPPVQEPVAFPLLTAPQVTQAADSQEQEIIREAPIAISEASAAIEQQADRAPPNYPSTSSPRRPVYRASRPQWSPYR